MNTEQQSAENGLASLKRDYRTLGAPPYLATRIRAGLAGRAGRRRRRRPLFAAIAIAVCVLAVLTFLPRQQVLQPPSSMASLSLRLTSVRLPPSPSLARLRSVRTPPLPPRPAPPKPAKPGKASDVHTHYPEEKTHEVT